MPTYEFISPTQLRVVGSPAEIQHLDDELRFESKIIVEEIRRLRKNRWFVNKYGTEARQEKLDELESQRIIRMVTIESDREATVYSGFSDRFDRRGFHRVNTVNTPEPKSWAVAKSRAHRPRYYQVEAKEALQAARHGAVSLPTGAGKTDVIMDLIRETGQRTLVMAPGESIARQLYKKLGEYLGGRRVGLYGDGRKDMKQDVIVGIAASLARVEPDTPNWRALSGRPVFITDESHLVAAATFKKVCIGLAEQAVFRWFVSATQFRNDGSDLLLEGLTGPIVYEKDLYELVEQGYLARPVHICVGLKSRSTYGGPYEDMIVHHFYENRDLHAVGAQLAMKFQRMTGLPSLILIDHVSQFGLLYPHLGLDVGFAHGGLTKDNRDTVPQIFWKSENEALVDAFNARDLPILVGTSCISTGTDLQTTGALIYLQAGKSEIKVRQAIGRGTRLVEGKKKFYFVDFGVQIDNLPGFQNPLFRHFKERTTYYKDVQYIRPEQLGLKAG